MIQIKVMEQPTIKIGVLNELVWVGDYETYSGEHIITPKAFEQQKLLTKGYVLDHNIIVKEIPYKEEANEHGVTVIIGYKE